MMQSLQSDEEFLKQYQTMIDEARNSGQQPMPVNSMIYGGPQKQNLVEWQLDFKPELQDIERFLRSAILKRDPKTGREEWVENPDPGRRLFNETGVQDMLRFIFTLVNKNKVLSNYSAEEIRQRVRVIKHELRMLIYNNYEEYGMDNPYKMNNYSIVVHTIGSLIEDAYRRAMNGEERKDLNQARVVQQNDPVIPNTFNFMAPQQQNTRKSWLKPWTWGR